MKNLIITGSTRGLGLNHARYLSREKYNIALVDLSENACDVYGEVSSIDELLKSLHKETKNKFYRCDLTDAEETKKTFEKIFDDFGEVHGCVLNAGGDVVGTSKKADGKKPENNDLTISDDDNRVIMDRNYLTCFNSMKAAYPYFKEQGYGSIVTTSSTNANQGMDSEISYSIAKTAIIQLTRSAAVALRNYNVTVNSIAPSGTLTGRFIATANQRGAKDREKIFSKSASSLLNPAEPDDISGVVSFLLSDKAAYISGQIIRIDGGQSPFPI